MNPDPAPSSEIILYQTVDGRTRLEVQLQVETVWLTQAQMAELFETSVPNVSMHILLYRRIQWPFDRDRRK
jgi:hypothetical protein